MNDIKFFEMNFPENVDLCQLVPFLTDRLIYGHGGHLGHVTWIFYIHICYPFLLMLHIKFRFDWPSGFRGEDV